MIQYHAFTARFGQIDVEKKILASFLERSEK